MLDQCAAARVLDDAGDRDLGRVEGREGDEPRVVAHHLGLERREDGDPLSYNVLQRLSYLFVIFVLFPLVIWTGLALSPGFDSAFPATVNLLGGRQSARTLHFFITIALVLFLLVHVVMVWRAGFVNRMRAMITGRAGQPKERI